MKKFCKSNKLGIYLLKFVLITNMVVIFKFCYIFISALVVTDKDKFILNKLNIIKKIMFKDMSNIYAGTIET